MQPSSRQCLPRISPHAHTCEQAYPVSSDTCTSHGRWSALDLVPKLSCPLADWWEQGHRARWPGSDTERGPDCQPADRSWTALAESEA